MCSIDVLPTSRRFQISLQRKYSNENIGKMWRRICVQFFARGRNNKLVALWVGVPLHVCDIPCSALREKSWYFEWRLEVEDEQTASTAQTSH
jgi:hypothetical protein